MPKPMGLGEASAFSRVGSWTLRPSWIAREGTMARGSPPQSRTFLGMVEVELGRRIREGKD